MLTYYDWMFYGFYDVFCCGFVNALDTVSVFYEIDNFMNVDYDPRHDYVFRRFGNHVGELFIFFVDCDDFFLHKYGCFGLSAGLGHTSQNLQEPRDDTGLRASRSRPVGHQLRVRLAALGMRQRGSVWPAVALAPSARKS